MRVRADSATGADQNHLAVNYPALVNRRNGFLEGGAFLHRSGNNSVEIWTEFGES